MNKDNFDFKEYEKWVKQLEIATSTFEVFLKQFLLQMAQRVVARGKPRTPVDTGFLRNSWYIGDQKINQNYNEDTDSFTIDTETSDVASIAIIGNTLYVEIGLDTEYASYIEYGHKGYSGKYMLTMSIDDVQKQIPDRFDKEFKEFIKKYKVAD